jgi:hypothetical protein
MRQLSSSSPYISDFPKLRIQEGYIAVVVMGVRVHSPFHLNFVWLNEG